MSTEAGQELCLGCATANPIDADFCCQCGAPLTSRASGDPYLSVFAEGFAIRKAIAGSNKPIVLIGVCLISISSLAGVIASLMSGGGVVGVVMGLCFLALWGAIVYKMTRNYFRLRQDRRIDS